jgi:hypothetical protein
MTAAELEEDSLEGVSRLGGDQFPDAGGAGERDHVDPRIGHDLLCDGVLGCGDDIDDTGGHFGLFSDQPSDAGGRPRGVRVGLQYHRVACRQGLAEFVQRDLEGEVPGHYGGDYPHRLLPNHPMIHFAHETATGKFAFPLVGIQ